MAIHAKVDVDYHHLAHATEVVGVEVEQILSNRFDPIQYLTVNGHCTVSEFSIRRDSLEPLPLIPLVVAVCYAADLVTLYHNTQGTGSCPFVGFEKKPLDSQTATIIINVTK